MIRFVYPNIDELDRFIGCGRYLTIVAGDPLLTTTYHPARPNVSHVSRITTAASIIAPEFFDAEKQVYEAKDHPSAGIGDSLGLAYFLALIARSRHLRWDHQEQDIWCTGVIGMNRGTPELKNVFRNQFDAKLPAFLQNAESKLFLVPLANFTEEHQAQCVEAQARCLMLPQLASLADHDLFTRKTIVLLHGNELESLVAWLFPQTVRLQNPRDFTVKIRRTKDNEVVGTGFVISLQGHIVTCAHIVEQATGLHPTRADAETEILIYFPNAPSGQVKTRRARVAAYLEHYYDDVVLLQILGDPPPVKAEQLAVLGGADASNAHPFRAYGYQRTLNGVAGHAQGTIVESIEPPDGLPWKVEPLQVQFESGQHDMSGAAVIDMYNNRIVGIISSLGLPVQTGRSGWAVNARILFQPPFNLTVGTPPPQRREIRVSSVQPRSAEDVIAPGTIVWDYAPSALAEWVGRDVLLQKLCDDWRQVDTRISGVIGFGGEGKSSLARRWIDGLRQGLWPETPTPYAVFGWNFYSRPTIDQFFEALFRFMTGGKLDPQDYPSTSAKVHVIIGYLGHASRYLFVLDGLEVMQHHDEDRYGEFRSQELRDFLLAFLAPGKQSFCLLTSRIPVLEFLHYTPYRHHEMSALERGEGLALLHKLGVHERDYGQNALDDILTTWGCHALTLSLVAKYIGLHQAIPSAISEDASIYERVTRILTHYDEYLSDTEQSFLMIFSAFRIPVAPKTLELLLNRDIPSPPPSGRGQGKGSLTPSPPPLGRGQGWGSLIPLLERLIALRLLSETSQQTYSAHPLILGHYRTRVQASDPAQLIVLHQQIKAVLLESCGSMPENPTLEELTPLIEVVYHECQAGKYDSAYQFLREELNQKRYYLPDVLGAWETYLSIMREFFPAKDTSRNSLLRDPAYQSSILHEVGFCFMMLGQLQISETYYRRSLEIKLKQGEWRRASLSYQNLTELYVNLGRLQDSLKTAEEALRYARRAQDREQERDSLADLAWAHHFLGNFDAVDAYFTQIASMETTPDAEDDYGYILHVIRHAEYLRKTGRLDHARTMLARALTACERNGYQDYISLCHRIAGDLDLAANRGEAARQQYDLALETIRRTSRRDILIDALLARGRWHLDHGARQTGFDALREALNYAVEGGFRFYEADIRFALARAFLSAAASTELAESVRREYEEHAAREHTLARQICEETGYYWGKLSGPNPV